MKKIFQYLSAWFVGDYVVVAHYKSVPGTDVYGRFRTWKAADKWAKEHLAGGVDFFEVRPTYAI